MQDANRQASGEHLPVLVTEDDIAAWLGVTPRTVLNWTKSGKLPRPVKLGETRAPKRWVASHIAEWVERQALAA